MTDDQRSDGLRPPDPAAPEGPAAESPAADDAPTQAWPSLATPAASAAPPGPSAAESQPAARDPWEPSGSLPSTHVSSVGETGSFGATPAAAASRRGAGLRWVVAIVGVALVAAASIVVASLVGGRPATSTAMGYMPANTVVYTEARLDLPGDQRDKLASFLKSFPGFQDSGPFDAKLNEALDRVMRMATHDAQTWTTDIAPWFGGQIAVGVGLPDPAAGSAIAAANATLFVATIRDRGKAIAWIQKTGDKASLNQTSYGDAELFVNADQGGAFALAVNDKVLLGGTTTAVKAAIDTSGKSAFAEDDAIEAALATIQKDYVAMSVTNVKAYGDWIVRMMGVGNASALAETQIDETILGLLPAWQATSARFENDALVSSSVMPSVAIGHDAASRADEVVGHVPAKTVLFLGIHDVGDSLSALLGKFRPLPEAKPFFEQLDRALNLVGGFDATFGWWGDAAVVASPLDDGTIGAGLVIKPRKPDEATRLLSTLNSFIQIGGASSGISLRTVDHNGTQVSVISSTSQFGMGTLPAGYKAEFAWAANADVAVVGYGESFVNAVLDATGPSSLGGDARFQALLTRVGAENIGLSFVDLGAIRTLIEPLAQKEASADEWAYYTKEIQPYLAPFDAAISAIRKDGSVDHTNGVLTVH